MAPYHLFFAHRSDGKIVTTSKGKEEEPNEPTPEQLDQTPDAKGMMDYYKAVAPGDQKEIEWRRKLGGMLQRELGGEEHKGQLWILHELPENYRLFEHLKYSRSESGETQRPARTHAKGGNERQDAYLYGHPLGRKKRYRCPADFFNHLLWLITDPTGNPDNCTCKICCPEELPKNEPPPTPTSPTMPAEGKHEESRGGVKALKNAEPKKVSSSPAPPMTAINPAPAQTPSSLAPPRSREQELDSHHNQFIYRPGEIVWFNRGAAWGLAVITNREFFRAENAGNQNRPRYLLQPLSHPYDHPSTCMISDEAMLRPWLAWSAPDPTHDQLKGLTFESVNWQDVVNGRYGQHDAEVDGSILAAKSVDESYTPFDQINIQGATPGTTYWNGLYIGGEKIWVGEPVRIRSKNVIEVLVVHFMMTVNQPNNTTPIFVVIGDQYRYATVSYDASKPPPSNTHLPKRMQADLAYRNSVTQPRMGQVSYWALSQAGAQVTLAEVRGRWYESGLLLPTLQTLPVYENDVRGGVIGDVGLFMNGRCDNPSNGDRVGTRKLDRRSALGASVPPGCQISRGLDELPAPHKYSGPDPRSAPIDNPIGMNDGFPSSENLGVHGTDMEQFMNLDGVDAGTQRYSNDGSQYYIIQ